MTPANMDLEHAADSTIAKASARILMPIMVGVLAVLLTVCGALLVRVLNGVEQTISEVQDEQREARAAAMLTSEKVTTVDKKVSLMAQRVDEMLIRQVDQNSEAIKSHEQRLERIERAVPLP